jgi:hypothetical protein
MSYYEMTANVSLIAGTGGTTIYKFVEMSGDKEVITADSAGAEIVGVAAESVLVGVVAPISTLHGSIVMITLAGTLSAGALVMSDASGDAIASATAGSLEAGQLIEGGVDGDIVPMLLQPTRRHAA